MQSLHDWLVGWRRQLTSVSAGLAYCGGLILAAAALFTVGAVAAAAAGFPILGDSEIVELAAGTAVASFLPYCQMLGGHIAITIFTDWTPGPFKRVMNTLASAITLAVVLTLTWRFLAGGINAYDRHSISMFLQIPKWWGYAIAATPMTLWAVTAVFTFVEMLISPYSPEETMEPES